MESYGRSAESIAALYAARKEQMGTEFERMRHIQQVMDGEIVLPLPELGTTDAPAVANLAQQGMSQLARRIASVEPTYFFPSLDPGNEKSDDLARDRHRVANGWRADNKMKRRLGKRARYFLAYATAPVVVKPNKLTGLPQWIVKDPLQTFPGEDTFENYTPADCIFVTTHTWAGLKEEFGQDEEGMYLLQSVQKPYSWDDNNEAENDRCKFEVLEYLDAEKNCLVLLGHPSADGYPSVNGFSAVELRSAENLAKQCLAVVPGSISLSKQLGHFDGIIGMYQTQAALMALAVVAQRRTVWPREWLVARAGENPEVVTVPDPARGQPGELRGGTLERQDLDPSHRALEMMDRLEYSQRMTAGLPAEFGGMSSTNVRTGRRGAQVMGASIDFTIAEAQDIFADSLCAENKLAIAVDKAYFNRKKIYQITTRSYAGQVKYKPSELWETDAHVVDYPIAGTDLQNLPIEGGQRVAMQTLSREGFMEIDPVVKDPKAEIQRMQREGVQTAFLSSIQTLAAAPDGPYQPAHLARLDELLASGMELYQAVTKLQTQLQEEQAAAQQTTPEQQPGLSVPGQGVEEIPTIPEDDTSMQNLTTMLGQLGTAQTARRYRPTG